MKVKITKKYLVFPVNKEAAVKKISFTLSGEEVYCLNIRLDNLLPDFSAYVDVGRFMGEELELSVDPQMQLCFTEAEEMRFEDEYKEPLRPQIHFSTKNGWNNDPNGLVFMDGRYHLFYQYNPCSPLWNNMHWGHAVSTDLLHWQEKEAALFSEPQGTMFSGSAIVDHKNLTGLGSAEQKAMLLYYTFTAEPRPQCLAYSIDSGKTFVKYEGNPILPHVEAYNRDPKVVWCEELGCHVMALYLEDDRYGLYRSDDLISWKPFQQISLSGDGECPDLFCLRDSEGKRRWVLMGASDKYLVGEFKKGQFIPLQSTRSLHYGKINYAAQSFSDLPDDRVVRIAWNRLRVEGGRFSQQMGFPTEMSLEKISGEYFLRSRLIPEIENLIETTDAYSDLELADTPVSLDVAAAPLLIRMRAKRNTSFELKIFGGTIRANPSHNELFVQTSTALKEPPRLSPLSVSGKETELTLLIDRCSLELFADDGKICLTERFVCDFNLPYVAIAGEGRIQNIEINTLKSIWREKQ